MSSRPVPAVTPNTLYLTSNQLRERYGGRSRAWPDRMVRAGRLPKPYRISGSWLKYWRVDELDAHDAAQVASAEPTPRQHRAA